MNFGAAKLTRLDPAAAELGIVSDLLHEGGNSYANYPTMEFKHDLGILLFSCIVTFLFILSHPWSNIFRAYPLLLLVPTPISVLSHLRANRARPLFPVPRRAP